MSKQDKPKSEELSGHLRLENRTILCVFLVAFVLAVMIGLILRFTIYRNAMNIVRYRITHRIASHEIARLLGYEPGLSCRYCWCAAPLW